jgi:hypothetical protein
MIIGVSGIPSRRELFRQKQRLKAEFETAVRVADPNVFRLLLKAWDIEEGSAMWRDAWDAWRDELKNEKQRNARLEELRRRRRPSSRGAPVKPSRTSRRAG